MRFALIVKTLRGRWKNAVGWASVAIIMTAIQLYIYPSILDSADAMDKFIEVFPKELIAMFRIEDYTSAVGFLETELYSMMIPIVFIAIGASWGASAGAEEEETGTSEIIFALPIRRSSVLLSKLVALWIVMIIVGGLIVAEIALGAGIVDLDLSGINLLAGTVACLGLGILFHALGMAVSALTGSRGLGVGASIAVGLLSFLIFALAPLVETFDSVLPFNPFQLALGESPLKNGFDWVGLSWLGIGSLAGYFVSLISINRRDLNS